MTNTSFYDESLEKNKIEKGVLYLVATPIGNTADISERALKVLKNVDAIAAEDTRNTGKLLSVFDIKQNYITYHEHNKAEAGEKIALRLLGGESIALVTDAGMPAISDPGEDLVKLCNEKGIKVTCVPGPCAFITALVLSGLDTRRFIFEGFLSAQNGERMKRLDELKDEDRTLIFYEAPHKLKTTLSDMLSVFGDRKIALCRELTKLNEEVLHTTLTGAVDIYKSKEPRGEYVLVLEGAKKSKANDWENLSVDEHIDFYTKSGMPKMDAIKKVAKDRGVPKGDIYKLTINKK
ncbi:MAG: 16S rRNA (cytidine(1402)-2'-O)-methyltransferase [Ruminococcaceae bacterium]|nr:16S rRNA (cytidine(1402)-2'-O)-methyltransferase [Oscillospiraceae bacterium]